jgi:dienelactone hydrolase
MLTLTAEDGHKLSAYKATPKGTPRGALVVIQEIFGVNHHIKSVTDRFAGEGYLSIAPRCSIASSAASRPATSRPTSSAAAPSAASSPSRTR